MEYEPFFRRYINLAKLIELLTVERMNIKGFAMLAGRSCHLEVFLRRSHQRHLRYMYASFLREVIGSSPTLGQG